MVAVWPLISASVHQAGGVTIALVSVPQECGDHSVTRYASAATAVPVIPRKGHVFAPLACSPLTAFSLVLLATMALPASLVVSAMGHPVTPRMEPASAPKGEQDPAVMCPVHSTLMASSAP